jgi:acyl-CoA thioester hydrolase
VFETPIQVDYIDTDAMAVVHHSSYCRWLERARILWLDSIDEPYKKMESEGLGLPLRELNVLYKKPLRFGDRAIVEIVEVDMTELTVEIRYKIRSEDRKQIHALASTKHVLVQMNRSTGAGNETEFKLLPVPEAWRNKWQQLRDQK